MSTPEPGAPPPPPITRTLAVVLREALAKGEEVRMLVAKGLADSALPLGNPTAYMNVELEGQAVTVPKLAGAGLGGTATGYAVYVFATNDFLIAVGTVAGTGTGASGGGIIPIGGVIEWLAATAPGGWLICDGSAFSSATYPALAAVLGTTTLPDLRKRVPVGAGSGLGVGGNDGAAEGSRSIAHHHRLTAGVAVSVSAVGDHSHGAGGNHNHSLTTGDDFAGTFGNTGQRGTAGTTFTLTSSSSPVTGMSGDHTHPAAGGHGHSASGSVDSDTSGGGPNNAPSYYVVNFIVRAT